ncbi:MAG: hypothetical protein ABIR68_19820 [Ilumatobacteraceae bacterium]
MAEWDGLAVVEWLGAAAPHRDARIGREGAAAGEEIGRCGAGVEVPVRAEVVQFVGPYGCVAGVLEHVASPGVGHGRKCEHMVPVGVGEHDGIDDEIAGCVNEAVCLVARVDHDDMARGGFEFADGDVSIEPSVAVLAGPPDDDGVGKVPASSDLEGEFREVALDLGDRLPSSNDLSHLGPLPHDVLGQRMVRRYATRVAPLESSCADAIGTTFPFGGGPWARG